MRLKTTADPGLVTHLSIEHLNYSKENAEILIGLTSFLSYQGEGLFQKELNVNLFSDPSFLVVLLSLSGRRPSLRGGVPSQ